MRRRSPFRSQLEALEGRFTPSTINWVNDGQANDSFAAVFGGGAEAARDVVRAAIDSWERVIDDFNNGNGNEFDLTVRMATAQDVTLYGFGGGSVNTTSGQAPRPLFVFDGDEKPIAATILIGRGTDGLGAGWFIDATPEEHSEFLGPIENAFAGGDSAAPGSDFYSLVLAELTHCLGITGATGSRYRTLVDDAVANNGNGSAYGATLTDSLQLDTDAPGSGATLWVFSGPSITYLMTDLDSGGKNLPTHTATDNTGSNVVVANNQIVRGNTNCGNAFGFNGRTLPSNGVAKLLADLYDYDLAAGGPEWFGTFYAVKTAAGELVVRGGEGDSDDEIEVLGLPNAIFVGVAPGIPVGGTDPFNAGSDQFISSISTTDLDEMTVSGRDGDDTVTLLAFFAPVTTVVLNGDDDNDLLDASLVDDHPIFLFGGDGGDTLLGGGGNDVLVGGAGTDFLFGAAGIDLLNGGDGTDFLHGEDGDDTLYGQGGADVLTGGPGVDQLFGEGGNDYLVGGSVVESLLQPAPDAGDLIDGGDGDDTVMGDNLIGNEASPVGGGGDLIAGGDGNDTVHGAVGNDLIVGGDGDDDLLGQWGDDALFGGADDDDLEGGSGNDWLVGEAGEDTVSGGSGADTLIGGTGADELAGGDGNDALFGGTYFAPVFDGSPDVLDGDAGDDLLIGDNFAFGPAVTGGDDTLRGGTGNDAVYGQLGADSLVGGSGSDSMFGGDGDDSLHGQAGNDSLDGQDGNDAIFGGSGNDAANGGAGDDDLSGEAGSDSLAGGGGQDDLRGGTGDDELDGDAGDDLLRGGDGNDQLDGGDGNDIALGEGGGDVLLGGDGRDLLIGGLGADLIEGGGGEDILIAGFTAYDQDDAALNLVRAEWTSAHPYAQRVNNISGVGNNPNRLNGDIFLIPGTTAQDDDARDVLTGSADRDWFLFDPFLDAITDLAPNEQTN